MGFAEGALRCLFSGCLWYGAVFLQSLFEGSVEFCSLLLSLSHLHCSNEIIIITHSNDLMQINKQSSTHSQTLTRIANETLISPHVYFNRLLLRLRLRLWFCVALALTNNPANLHTHTNAIWVLTATQNFACNVCSQLASYILQLKRHTTQYSYVLRRHTDPRKLSPDWLGWLTVGWLLVRWLLYLQFKRKITDGMRRVRKAHTRSEETEFIQLKFNRFVMDDRCAFLRRLRGV